MTGRILGVVVGLLIIALVFPTIRMFWGLDNRLDRLEVEIQQIDEGIARIEGRLGPDGTPR